MSSDLNFPKGMTTNPSSLPAANDKPTKSIGAEIRNQAINCAHTVRDVSSDTLQIVQKFDALAKLKLGCLAQEIGSRLGEVASFARSNISTAFAPKSTTATQNSSQPTAPARPASLSKETMEKADTVRGILKELNSFLVDVPTLPEASARPTKPLPQIPQNTPQSQPAAPKQSQPAAPTQSQPGAPTRSAKPLPATPSKEAIEKTRDLTTQLDSALVTAGKTGNNAILKFAIQEIEKELNHLSTMGLNPSVLTKLQTKLDECKQKKAELPSEKKQVLEAIMHDVTQGNKDIQQTLKATIESQFKAQSKGLKDNEHHQMEISGHIYLISQDSQAAKGTTIPSIWKRESEAFADGGAAQIYGGQWIRNPRNAPELAIKQDLGGNELGDLRNEVILAQLIHANGDVPGVVPIPFMLGDTSVVMHRQEMDGTKLRETVPGYTIEPAELMQIVSTTIDGLAAIHNVNIYHGDNKAGNLLWDGKKLMISDLEGARSFDKLFSLEKFPTVEDVMGNYTLTYPQLENKLEGILQHREAEYNKAQSPDDKKAILTDLMKEVAPLLKANDEYALGLALCESLIPSFKKPVKDITSDPTFESLNTQLNQAYISDDGVKDKIFSLLYEASAAIEAAPSYPVATPAAVTARPPDKLLILLDALDRGVFKEESLISYNAERVSNEIEALVRSQDPRLLESNDGFTTIKDDIATAIENFKGNFKNSLGGLPETGTTTESLDKTLRILNNYNP